MKKSEKSIIIFTDGASRGNPGAGGWAAIIIENVKSTAKAVAGNVKEIGGRENSTTNNRMELLAAIRALSQVAISFPEEKNLSILIYTDSSYVINGITKWMKGWMKNNWTTSAKKEVLNQDLWQELSGLIEGREIKWEYLKGHAGIVGNERCDQIATDFADGNIPKLYDGFLSGYDRNILNVKMNEVESQEDRNERKNKKNRSKQKAYSYLSLLDGVLIRHKTWEECEKRVKGKNAKFKKALSAGEEEQIIKEWGVR